MLTRRTLCVTLWIATPFTLIASRASAAPEVPVSAVDLLQSAATIARKITVPMARVRAYIAIGGAEYRAGAPESGMQWLQAAHRIAMGLSDPATKQNLFLLLLAKEMDVGTQDLWASYDAFKLRTEIMTVPELHSLPDGVDRGTRMAAAFAAGRNPEWARSMFSGSVVAARTIVEFVPRAEQLSLSARKSMEAGITTEAPATALEARDALSHAGTGAESKQERDRLAGLYVTGALADSGDFEAAFALLDTISDDYLKSCGLLDIVKAQVRAKRLSAAIDTSNLIRNASVKALALLPLAQGAAETGDISAARAFANAISPSRLRSQASCAIAIAQAKSH